MRGQTEITIGFRAGAGANGTPRGSSVSGSHRLKQIRLILMTCIDSELLCVLLFKCPFSVWHPQGEISPLWSALSYGKPRLLWLSWKIPRKSSHVLMMERGELWSYGVLIIGVIKIDSNAVVAVELSFVFLSHGGVHQCKACELQQEEGKFWSAAAASMTWI